MRALLLLLVLCTILVAFSSEGRAAGVNCSNFSDQASAQSYFDSRGGSPSNNVEGLDADHDGVACGSLRCPCKAPGAAPTPTPTYQVPTASPTPTITPTPTPTPTSCQKPSGVQRIKFSKAKYPSIFRHFKGALRRGWPRTLVINRKGADARRDRLLSGIPTKAGKDRDEYPPAVGRGRGTGLTRGRNPRGWKGDVRYVLSSENRSHGASLGGQLSPFCNGTRFRYEFTR